jgi:Abnormal spindle-like microcephaly-assoc'd, ASPM-SPD-2-Hydin
MILRAVLLVSLLPLSALAQIQVFILNGTTLTPVGPLLSVGSATLGDTIETQFRVQNSGTLPVALSVSLSGEGFAIQCLPAPNVPPGEESAFCVDFTPTIFGSFSAVLQVNTVDITLTGSSVAAAALTVSGSAAPLSAGATIDFGSVVVTQSQSETFKLFNTNSAPLAVNSVTVSGAGFSGPTGQKFPLSIGPGQSAPFQIAFSPQAGIPYQGTLTVDGRAFNLTGEGLAPLPPTASLVFASTIAASAQTNSISIPLASASETPATGTITMKFQPSVPGATAANDPAIQFYPVPKDEESVSIAIGATTALIGGQSQMEFQTGTTAGTITFTLTLANEAPQQTTMTIAGAAIDLGTVTAVRIPAQINVGIEGFDNTYTASQLAFTFYDLQGTALPQGVIQVDAGSAFQQYFSTTQYGGMFQLLLQFPVTGDDTQIGFVSVQIANSVGTTSTSPPIAIGN